MRKILRFIKFLWISVMFLCVVVIAGAMFPEAFSWSKEAASAQLDKLSTIAESVGDSERFQNIFRREEETETIIVSSETRIITDQDVNRADYVPPEQMGEEISQSPAEGGDLRVSTDIPDTNTNEGEEYEFDSFYYPYYGMLTDTEKRLYEQLYANMMERNIEVNLSVDVDSSSLSAVFESVCNDHPELFWLDVAYQYAYYANGTVAKVSLKYNETNGYFESAKASFDAVVNQIVEGASGLSTDLEKEQYVHDAINEISVYDESAILNQSAYSALVNGASVCAGYSKAFQYIMQQLGIPCYYITGEAGGAHAWNEVYINGEFQNVDVSWDDGLGESYYYFNMEDSEFFITHTPQGLSAYLQ